MHCPWCGGTIPARAIFCVHCGKELPSAKANTEAVILGTERKTGKPVGVGPVERLAGTYIVGKPGMGKTTLLLNLMLQDARAGRGFCFIDPHRDATEQLIACLPAERLSDVVWFDARDTAWPIGLNLLACDDPMDGVSPVETAEQVVHIFKKLYGPTSPEPSWGPRLESLLRFSALTLIPNGGTLLEIPALLTDEDFRQAMVRAVNDAAVQDFWESRFGRWRSDERTINIESTINKIDPFSSLSLTANIVGQSSSRLDFGRLMDQAKILLVQLPPTLGTASTLLGATIVSQMLHAAHKRSLTSEENRRPFYLFADEYQRFATEDFATLLDEARKFAVGTTIAHQGRSQLKDTASRGGSLRAGTVIVLGVEGGDADELAHQFRVEGKPGEPRLEQITKYDPETGYEAPVTHKRLGADWRSEQVHLYERKEGPRGTIADAEDELAVTLRGLSQFEAYVKISAGVGGARQHRIWLAPVPEACGPSELGSRLGQVREQTRATYGRSREEVEQEIRDRRTKTRSQLAETEEGPRRGRRIKATTQSER